MQQRVLDAAEVAAEFESFHPTGELDIPARILRARADALVAAQEQALQVLSVVRWRGSCASMMVTFYSLTPPPFYSRLNPPEFLLLRTSWMRWARRNTMRTLTRMMGRKRVRRKQMRRERRARVVLPQPLARCSRETRALWARRR